MLRELIRLAIRSSVAYRLCAAPSAPTRRPPAVPVRPAPRPVHA